MKQLLIGLALGLSISAAIAFETGPYSVMRDLAGALKDIDYLLDGKFVNVESPDFKVSISISKAACPELWVALEKEKAEKAEELNEMVKNLKPVK